MRAFLRELLWRLSVCSGTMKRSVGARRFMTTCRVRSAPVAMGGMRLAQLSRVTQGAAARRIGVTCESVNRRHVAGVVTLSMSVLLAVLALSPSVAFAANNPHTAVTTDGTTCAQCHAPHQAAIGSGILKSMGDTADDYTPVAFCYGCHDGNPAVNVKTGINNGSFEGLSGHSVEAVDTGDGDLTNVCSDCHYPHADSATRFRLAETTITITLADDSTVDRAVTGADNSWCLACHDDQDSWYRSLCQGAYPALDAPTRAASGYPTSGTFPGATVYATPAKNAHANIPAGSMDDWVMASREATRVAGDCLWCHSGHRGKSEYDGLIARFNASTAQLKDTRDGEYAEVCFLCHTTDGLVEAPDIKTAALGDPVDSGHTVRTAVGVYAPGAPLPCYECHNPHGSSRGNTANISDTLGQNLDPRDPADPTNTGASAAKVRQFCFSCHVTHDADSGTGRPWAWDSTAASGAGAYVPVPTTAKVVGLSRNVAVGANDLRIPLANGHNKADTDRSCYECHGDVHKPMSGTSEGGVECSICHSALNGMVDDTTTYHHVLDDPNWDQAPDTGGTYPTSLETLSCVSCHVDHSDYEPLPGKDAGRADGKAFSLRNSGTVARPVATDTDAGLCLSCHTTERNRNTTGQKANVITETKVWSLNATWWAVSPHNYDSPGQFNDGSTFRANCAKCHGTLEGTLSSGKFAVHFSSEQRLLNALGDPVQYEVNEEQMCFRCHSEVSDFVANNAGGTLLGDPKPSVSGTTTPSYSWDWYGTQPMKKSNVVIYRQMMAGANTFGHKPHLYSGKHLLSPTDETQAYISANKHVECADCHNHHVVGQARHEFGTTNAVSESLRGVQGVAFASSALSTVKYPSDAQVTPRLSVKTNSDYEYEICLKCHSNANTNYNTAVWGGTKTSVSNVGIAKPYGWSAYTGPSTAVVTPRWTNVAADFNLGNQSRHPVIGPLPATDPGTGSDFYGSSRVTAGQLAAGWKPGDTMYCSDCHGDPNAPSPWLLDVLGNVVLDGNGDPTMNPDMANYAQGPHGSSVAFSLRGPRTDWPVATTGAYAGQLITMNMLNSGYDGLFCSNCHPGVRANKVHGGGQGRHAAAACVNCHTLIPHGGGMSRLIADGDDSMPARFAYNNDKRTSYVASFIKRPDPNNYTKTDCRVTSYGTTACGSQHAQGSSSSMENW